MNEIVPSLFQALDKYGVSFVVLGYFLLKDWKTSVRHLEAFEKIAANLAVLNKEAE